MNMKKLLPIAIAGIFAGITACTSILDTAPTNAPASSSMWTTENLTTMGMSGLYHTLRIAHYPNGSTNYGYYAYDSWSSMTQQKDPDANHLGTLTVSSGLFSGTWQRWFEGVHRANDAIANIPVKSPISDALKGKYVAEAKFFRAFFYYRLNELYRGVPIYLEPIPVAECIKTQDTEEAVWEQIIKDLTDCINEPNFPNIDVQTGRVTKGAAYALRGKTYMQQKKYENAAADFAKVGECGYELFQGGYSQLFTEDNERCKEMIFSFQNISTIGYSGTSQHYLGIWSTWGQGGWSYYTPHCNAMDLYENADGTPFNWDDFIPGYNAMNPIHREVFFLRDTLNKNSVAVNSFVQARLDMLPTDIRAMYLPGGNEARIRQAFTNRDPRLEMNVVTPYSTFLGYYNGDEVLTTARWPFVSQLLDDAWTDINGFFLYYYRKFVYPGGSAASSGLIDRDQCPIDEPLIRYGHVVLLWAEALMELGKLSEAAEKVNLVRGRASVNMPNVQYVDQAELREKIRNEMRIELLIEGVTFFEEMRWRVLKETKYKPGNGKMNIWGAQTQAFVWQGDELYTWPVPASEIEKNPNLKKTPGWIY